MSSPTTMRLHLLGALSILTSCLINPTAGFVAGTHAYGADIVGKQLQFQPLLAANGGDQDTSISRDQLQFRQATSDDIDFCFPIESSSYPADEAASLEALEYRQAHAAPYFRVATLNNDDATKVIGFCCGTRCQAFTEESMSTTHVPDGKMLAIHSVVVAKEYRRQGIATAMLTNYMESISKTSADGLESTVLLAKSNLLSFYVQCGFTVLRPSPIVHGKELWYELEKRVGLDQAIPNEDEQWFVKTETFCKPFPQVKPHLEAHKLWVEKLRQDDGRCITSGYRVDAEGKPGGGGLMFLAAKNYEEAMELVLKDPLVANECVQWQLNGWIGQVGDVQLR